MEIVTGPTQLSIILATLLSDAAAQIAQMEPADEAAQLSLFYRFGLALVAGALVGLEREHAQYQVGHTGFAGIRTFTFISLFGCASAWFADQLTLWFLPAAFVSLTVLVGISYSVTARAADKGMTTEITALLVFVVGALIYFDQIVLGAALAVIVTIFLSLKPELQSLTANLDAADIYAVLKFAFITAIILPLLPDRTFGPLDVLNPYQIWLMVIFISGLNFAGYALMKVLGPRQGIALTGLVGGLVSSTAVALAFSQRSREHPALSRACAVAIIIASTTMFPRAFLVAAVLNPELGRLLTVPLLGTGLVGAVITFFLWRGRDPELTDQPLDTVNPFELRPALQFGALFAGVLWIARFAQDTFGAAGIYVSATLAGLTDVNAITISLAQLAQNEVMMVVAAQGVILATLTNTLVKGGIALALGSARLKRLILPVILLMLAVGLAMTVVLPRVWAMMMP